MFVFLESPTLDLIKGVPPPLLCTRVGIGVHKPSFVLLSPILDSGVQLTAHLFNSSTAGLVP